MTDKPKYHFGGIVHIPWESLTLDEVNACMVLGDRSARAIIQFVKDNREQFTAPGFEFIEPDRTAAAADWALVHIRRRLDLRAAMRAPDDALLREYVTIQQHINRIRGLFPEWVNLAFAATRG